MKFESDIQLDRMQRMGKPRAAGNFPRPIVARFEQYKDREEVRMAAPRTLVGTKYGDNDQYPKEVEDRRKKLYPVMREVRRENKKAVLVVDKLYINNDLYVTPSETQNKKEASVTRSS